MLILKVNKFSKVIANTTKLTSQKGPSDESENPLPNQSIMYNIDENILKETYITMCH